MGRCLYCRALLPITATARRKYCAGPCRVAHARQRSADEVAALRDELAAFSATVEKFALPVERRAFRHLTATPELAETMREALEAGRRVHEEHEGRE